MSLKAGTINDLTDSMAQAMIDTFNSQWNIVMGDAPKPENMDQLKLIFTSVAQGVVTHLKQHATDFKVTVTFDGTSNYTGSVTDIQ